MIILRGGHTDNEEFFANAQGNSRVESFWGAKSEAQLLNAIPDVSIGWRS